MSPILSIVEVLGRSEQGATKPFLCRGEDGYLYYLKGRDAGLKSLCNEWIAGNLAKAMGLPLPDFAIADVPTALVDGSDRLDIKDLGAGLAFASKRLDGARELTWEESTHFPKETQAKVLLFDWWVQNEDRTLTQWGGNPNLLVTDDGNHASRLWVFDFNLAFDESFSPENFRANHVFRGVRGEWPDGFRQQMASDMAETLAQLDGFFSDLPLEWQYLEGDENLPVQLDKNLVLETTERAFREADAFWNLL